MLNKLIMLPMSLSKEIFVLLINQIKLDYNSMCNVIVFEK